MFCVGAWVCVTLVLCSLIGAHFSFFLKVARGSLVGERAMETDYSM